MKDDLIWLAKFWAEAILLTAAVLAVVVPIALLVEWQPWVKTAGISLAGFVVLNGLILWVRDLWRNGEIKFEFSEKDK